MRVTLPALLQRTPSQVQWAEVEFHQPVLRRASPSSVDDDGDDIALAREENDIIIMVLVMVTTTTALEIIMEDTIFNSLQLIKPYHTLL